MPIDLSAKIVAFRAGETDDEYDVAIEQAAAFETSDGVEHPAYYPRTVTVPVGDDPTSRIRELVAEIRAAIAAERPPSVPLGEVDVG